MLKIIVIYFIILCLLKNQEYIYSFSENCSTVQTLYFHIGIMINNNLPI